MSKLEPCPWCGQPAVIEQDAGGYYCVRVEHLIDCYLYDEMARPVFDTAEEAERAWNRRTITEEVVR